MKKVGPRAEASIDALMESRPKSLSEGRAGCVIDHGG
jgi:hypothetical protein